MNNIKNMKMTDNILIKLYLEYISTPLSTKDFANQYGISALTMGKIVEAGCFLNAIKTTREHIK